MTREIETVAWLTEWKKDRIRAKGRLLDFREPFVKYSENSYSPLCRLSDAMERIAQLEAERAWQPIERAPKDGTHILLANKAGVSEGGWLTDIDHGADWEGQLGVAGWWRTDGTDWPPTHWMRLPAPPVAAMGTDGGKHE